jgi:hypothetical protein
VVDIISEAKNVAPKLANIVDGYFSNAESKEDGCQRTSILILTDGSPGKFRPPLIRFVVNPLHEPADQNETVDVIVEAARRLEENKVGGNLFRIYILQVGDDRTVASPLRKISNEVAQETHGKVRQISKFSKRTDTEAVAFQREY